MFPTGGTNENERQEEAMKVCGHLRLLSCKSENL